MPRASECPHDHLGRAIGHARALRRAAGLAPGTVVAFVHPDQWLDLYRVLHGPPTAATYFEGGEQR